MYLKVPYKGVIVCLEKIRGTSHLRKREVGVSDFIIDYE